MEHECSQNRLAEENLLGVMSNVPGTLCENHFGRRRYSLQPLEVDLKLEILSLHFFGACGGAQEPVGLAPRGPRMKSGPSSRAGRKLKAQSFSKISDGFASESSRASSSGGIDV